MRDEKVTSTIVWPNVRIAPSAIPGYPVMPGNSHYYAARQTDATPLQVAEAVRIGPYVMPKFSQRDLSDRQLDSIIRYVEFTKNPARPGGWGLGLLGPVPEGLVTWFLAIPALIVLCLLLGRRLPRGVPRKDHALLPREEQAEQRLYEDSPRCPRRDMRKCRMPRGWSAPYAPSACLAS